MQQSVVLERVDVDIDKLFGLHAQVLMFPSRRSIWLDQKGSYLACTAKARCCNVALLAGALCEHFSFTQYLDGPSLCHVHVIDLCQEVRHFLII